LHIPGELALQIDQPRAAIVSILGNQHLRGYGLTFHPNVLGGFLMVAIILTIPLIQKASRLWALALPVLFAGMAVSFSRSAWLALTTILILFGLFSFSSKPSPLIKNSILTGFVLVILAGAAGGIFTNRLSLSSLAEFTSLFGRGELLHIAISAIRDNPLFGIGPGNFPLYMLQFRTLDPPHFVHNVPFLIASEVGILGGLIWYWLWIKPLLFVRRPFTNLDPLLLSLIGGWMGICIIGLFDSYPWNLESGRLLSVSLLALIAKTNNQVLE
jgi:O-antigen ligase